MAPPSKDDIYLSLLNNWEDSPHVYFGIIHRFYRILSLYEYLSPWYVEAYIPSHDVTTDDP
jgi:hypothetical protein